jgi:hypothetical protein
MSRQAGQMAAQNVPVDPGATSALRGAEQQAQQGANPQATPQQAQSAEQGAQQAMAEASASLAARGEEIANDIALGRAIAQAGEKPLPASEMASAQGGHAGQSQPGEGQPAGQQTPGQPGGEQSAGQPGQGQQGSPQGGQQVGGQPMPGQPSGAQPGATMPAGAPLANRPIREAAQIAAALAGATEGGMPGAEAAAGQPGMGAMPGRAASPSLAPPTKPGMTSPFGQGGGGIISGSFRENQPGMISEPIPGPEEPPQGGTTPDSDKDAEPGDKKFAEKPWFAKLPPEVRNAIRASINRRAPRGYEETMQKYFENLE